MLRKPDTEEYICNKLLEFMDIKPFSKMKVTEFCKFANISRTSFYNYFDSLDDVIQKLEDDLINGLEDENNMSIDELRANNFSELVKALEYIHTNLDTYRLLVGENGDPYFQSRLANRSSKIMHNWLKESSIQLTHSQLRLMVENISGGRWQMYLWWANHPDDITVEEVAEITVKMIEPILEIINK